MPKIVSVHAPDFKPPTGKTQFMKIYITHNSCGTHSTGVWHDTAQAAINHKDQYCETGNKYSYFVIEVDQAQ